MKSTAVERADAVERAEVVERSHPVDRPPTRSRGARAASHPIALVALAGAILRFGLIARQPIGFDEDFTAVTVHQPPDRMMDIVSHDITPPLFYAFERIVVAIFDALGLHDLGGPGGPAVIRLMPTLAGIALIPLAAALATRLAGGRATPLGRNAGVWTALFVAFCPLTVWLSGFARVYALGACFVVASSLLLWEAVGPAAGPPTDRRPRPRGIAWIWLAYVVTAAAAIWTVYFGVFALAGTVLAVLWLRPGRAAILRTIAATGAACLIFIPWLIAASAQFGHGNERFWIEPLNVGQILGTAGQLLAGPAVADTSPLPAVALGFQAAVVGVWVLALGVVIVRWRGLDPSVRCGLSFGLVAASGVVLLVVVSLVRPILDARYATLSWLPMVAVAGAGLALLGRRLAPAAAAVLAVASLVLFVPVTRAQVRELIPELNDMVGPHDVVVTDVPDYLILLDESNATVREKLHVLSRTDPLWYQGTAAYPDGAAIHSIPQETLDNLGRIFWVAPPGVTSPLIPTTYHAIESRCVFLACLTVYEP